jgi:hypothetical protein
LKDGKVFCGQSRVCRQASIEQAHFTRHMHLRA